MSSYFVALIDIADSSQYARYLDGFDKVFEQYNGTVVAVEENPTVLEGQWPTERTVLIKFPSDEELLCWYRSSEYQELAKYRRNASTAAIALIHGRD